MADTYTITREQLRAIRKAHSISFHGSSIRGSDGKLYDDHTIRATIDQDDQTRVEIRVNGSFGGYDWSRDQRDEKVVGFDMIHSAQYSATWRTVTDHLREGDELALRWLPDHGSNGYLRMVGLHADTLELIVTRTAKTGKKSRMHFEVSSQICPQNSARMIRGATQRPDPYQPMVLTESWDSLMHRSDIARREYERANKEAS